VLTSDAQKSNLAVVPLNTNGLEVQVASAQKEPELLGWHVRKDMDPQYVPATTVLHTRRGAGEQQFLTLLVPIKAGETNPVQTARLVAGQNGNSAIEVLYRGGRRVTIDVAPNAQSPLRLR
jgi:hypothetical protein